MPILNIVVHITKELSFLLIDFFSSQTDYVYFLCGLAFFILAAISSTPSKVHGPHMPWKWLVAFCLIHGINEWLEVFAHDLGDTTCFSIIRTCITMASSICIIEFGRLYTKKIREKCVGRWIYIPLLALALSGFVEGKDGFRVSVIYVMNLTGWVWSSYAFWLASKNTNVHISRQLRNISLLPLIFAVANLIIVPRGNFFPASIINSETFYNITGIHAMMVKVILISSAVIAACAYYLGLCRGDYTISEGGRRLKIGMLAAAVIIMVVSCGWIATNLAQQRADTPFRENLLARSITIASALDPGVVSHLKGDPTDIAGNPYYDSLKEQLSTIHDANYDCCFAYIMGYKDGKVIFLADAEPTNSKDFSPPGSIYAEASPRLRSLFSGASPFVEGPMRDKWGNWISGLAGIEDLKTHKIVAVFGMDLKASNWVHAINTSRLVCIIITLLLSILILAFFVAFQCTEDSNVRISGSERRYRTLVECSPNWVTLCDNDCKCVTINQSGINSMGWTPEYVVGRKYQDLWPEDSRNVVNDAIENVLNGKECKFEADCIRPDGEKITWHVFLDPILDQDNKTTQFVVIAVNITERKKNEAELRIQVSAINAASDQIVMTKVNGEIEFVNLAFERETGYTFAEAVGNNPRILKSGKHDSQYYEELWSTILAGSTWHGEIVNLRKNGTHCVEDVTITPVKNDAGAIEHFIAIKRNITEKKVFEQQLDHLAHHDHLTNLPNRLLFSDRLTQELSKARKHNRKLAVMFVDLDHFKRINDTLGHSTGDLLLKTTSERLIGCLRETDTLARMGGDEFTVILTNVESKDGEVQVAKRILKALSEPFLLDGRELFVSASVGISTYPEDGIDVETLVKNADTAMYRAKEDGRNNYQLYTESLNAAALDRMNLEMDLRRAIDRDELILFYQPRVDLKLGTILGMEALIRWEHPQYGLVSPIQFIPLAEETGLIMPISEIVLHTACAQNKAWQNAGLPPVSVAVNISARSFERGDLVGTVKGTLAKTGLAPEYLELELTESTLMSNPSYAAEVLGELKSMGVKVSIDDFGTGYSSLGYLKRLPIDTVKIDRSFVKDITTNADDAAIASAVVAMAHSLKLKVIAEGVETLEQIEFLRSLECDEMQGYFVSRPVPSDKFEQLLIDGISPKSARIPYAA